MKHQAISNRTATRISTRRLVAVAAFIGLLSCLTDTQGATGKKMSVQGESLVLVKTEPGKLCFDRVTKGSLTLRSTYVAGKPGGIIYDEGRDYVVDYAAGTITRCANSRIPDYSTNCLYGQKDFDHTKFPSYRNHEWFVWADYRTTNGKPWAKPNDQSKQLMAVRKKLAVGESFPWGGVTAEVIARVAAEGFDLLDAPPQRLNAKDTPIPFHPNLWTAHRPTAQAIATAARNLLRR